jgi:hypothetical protein
MNVGKVLMGAGAVVGLLSSTVAMAAETRSSSALPSAHSVATLGRSQAHQCSVG